MEEIAAKEGMSLAKFLTKLHSEVLDHHGEVNNFASLLRCSCLIYRSRPPVAAMPDIRESRAQMVLTPPNNGPPARLVCNQHAER